MGGAMPRKVRAGNSIRNKQARFQHICPHCGGVAASRTTRELSPLTREIYIQCLNFECGHTWKSFLSIVATIVPSQIPNPKVFIPRSNRKLDEEAEPFNKQQIGLDGIPPLPPQQQ